MDSRLNERFDRLINLLRNEGWNERLDHPWIRDEIDWWLMSLERWLREGGRWPLSREVGEPHLQQLRRLEAKVDELLTRPVRCNLPNETAQQFPSFMTSLTAINDGNLAIGRKKFRAHQSAWLKRAKRCVVADPYLFHPGSESAEDYVAGLAEIIGTDADRVDFYFSAAEDHYKPSVAASLHSELMANYRNPTGSRRFTFYDCRDMHDRVWLQHASCVDDPPYVEWSARVVGASANGVRKRPTYVVDMDDDDANDYAKYLKNIRDSLVPAAITLIPPP